MEIDFDAKERKCKNCGRREGQHKAMTANCPFGRSRNFPNFYIEQFFEPKSKQSKGDQS